MLLVFVVSTMRKLLEDPRNRTCMQNFAQNCFFPKMAPLFYSTIFSRLFVNSTKYFLINFRSRWYTWYMSLRGIYLHACMHYTYFQWRHPLCTMWRLPGCRTVAGILELPPRALWGTSRHTPPVGAPWSKGSPQGTDEPAEKPPRPSCFLFPVKE